MPRSSSSSTQSALDLQRDGCNVCVVAGRLVRPPSVVLVNGEPVTNFELRSGEGVGTLIPIRWSGEHVVAEPGEVVAAVGAVVRRFFRVGGQTQSRTEILASTVVVLGSRSRERKFAGAVQKALAFAPSA